MPVRKQRKHNDIDALCWAAERPGGEISGE